MWVEPRELVWNTKKPNGERQRGKGGAECVGMSPDLFLTQCPIARQAARQVCSTCMARPQCYRYAVRTGPRIGIWGGIDEGERDRLAIVHDMLSSIHTLFGDESFRDTCLNIWCGILSERGLLT